VSGHRRRVLPVPATSSRARYGARNAGAGLAASVVDVVVVVV